MIPMSRRQMLRTTTAALLAGGAPLLALAKEEKEKGGYPFELPKLPYAKDALEPHIDAQTMEIHHGRHHKAYVDNLNAALKNHPDAQKMSLHELVHTLKVPDDVKTAVRNNGGGHLNHSMFWELMAKDGGGEPKGALAKEIDSAFDSFAKFQEAFAKAAMTRFGSGWAWLVVAKGKLAVVSTANQDSPLMHVDGVPQGKPILGLDVWEHAYYLKYQNKRADYVKAFWNVVNWKHVGELCADAMK